MKLRFCLSLAIALGFAACGPDDHLHLGQDGGAGSDAGSDAAPPATTLTSFVIDLVNNHTGDSTPAAFTTFSTLPDPDADTNNTAAFSSLFP